MSRIGEMALGADISLDENVIVFSQESQGKTKAGFLAPSYKTKWQLLLSKVSVERMSSLEL